MLAKKNVIKIRGFINRVKYLCENEKCVLLILSFSLVKFEEKYGYKIEAVEEVEIKKKKKLKIEIRFCIMHSTFSASWSCQILYG